MSIDGPNSDVTPGISIYQGGYAKCPPANVPGSCPYHNGIPWYWVYYAHEAGVCGPESNTGFIYLGYAATGVHNFKVRYSTGTYYFDIDDVDRDSHPWQDIEICWGGQGVVQTEWQNEMLNNGDSPGGTIANPEKWSFGRYQKADGWHDLNKPVGMDKCAANGYGPPFNPSGPWKCEVLNQDGTGFSRQWNVWDSRDP